ncbi:MAG: nitroreductase family protein [Allosphingosinicella sp.]
MFNDRSSTLTLLRTRRSGRPRDLVEPGPDPEQIRQIVDMAIRTPDHGKLHPWRFVHVAKNQREALAAILHAAYRTANPAPGRLEVEATDRFARQAPELIVALSSPVLGHKIPVWEQELSCGAACMNLLLAAHAMGFAGGWVTGWAAYSPAVLDAFGSAPERIAGFLFLGTPGNALEERLRPAVPDVYSEWLPA